MKPNLHRPPRHAQRLLNSFLRDDLAEEVNGDLDEKFFSTLSKGSLLKARVNYWYQVFHYVRPFAIRKSKQEPLNQIDMFGNYFKIAFRNLNKNRGYSFINIGGLAIGMAVAMLIGLWIYDELSFNKYHANYDRIAMVMQHQTFNGTRSTQVAMPRPTEATLRTTFGSDYQYISMSSWIDDHILANGDKVISSLGNFYQEDFPEMLSLKMLKGTRKGLHDPTSVLLAESTAIALFGDEDPINKPLRIDGKSDVKVIGVYEDLPYNTDFKDLKVIASWELFLSQQRWVRESENEWGNNSFQVFVQIQPNTTFGAASERIKDVKLKAAENERVFKPEFFLNPMSDWHLRSQWKEGKREGGRIQLVWMFGTIGVFVLFLACINFMNLSTARSEKRAKEVGIRMTIGSVRSQLINQFMSESFLVVLMAFLLGMGLVLVWLSWFNQLADKRIAIPFDQPGFWLAGAAFVIFTSLVAGSYPALYLSSFQPVKVLKGTFKVGRFASLPRKILVVIQFTVSVTLVIGTIIVYKQIQFTKDRPVGYDNAGLVMIRMRSPEFYGKYDILTTELKSVGAISSLAESSSPLTGVWSNNGGFDWQGKDPNLQPDFATIWVSHEYGKTLNWAIRDGRDFSREFATDSTAIILNETAVKFMGLSNPIGMEIKWGPDRTLHVVGVVKDMIAQSPYSPVKQTMYLCDAENVNWIDLRLNPAKPAAESIALVGSVLKKVVPHAPFEYKFVDQEYANKFAGEVRIGKLASVFAVLAIVISCLGLFGLASFVAEQRTKEIGIRKVLGATVGNLWKMLSKDFVLLVIVSCLIAAPTAYYFLTGWLKAYEYRTDVSWWIFAAAGGGALLVTLVTVSFQAIKAALMSPVKSLRSE